MVSSISMARCLCGKDTRVVDICTWQECRRIYICIGCNKDIKECICKVT